MRIHGAKQQRDALKWAPKNQLDHIFEVGIFYRLCICIKVHGPKLILYT